MYLVNLNLTMCDTVRILVSVSIWACVQCLKLYVHVYTIIQYLDAVPSTVEL